MRKKAITDQKKISAFKAEERWTLSQWERAKVTLSQLSEEWKLRNSENAKDDL